MGKPASMDPLKNLMLLLCFHMGSNTIKTDIEGRYCAERDPVVGMSLFLDVP